MYQPAELSMNTLCFDQSQKKLNIKNLSYNMFQIFIQNYTLMKETQYSARGEHINAHKGVIFNTWGNYV